MKTLSFHFDDCICVDTLMKQCGNVLIKCAAIPGKCTVMLNLAIHDDFYTEDNGVIHQVTILFCETVFVDESVSSPTIYFSLTLN